MATDEIDRSGAARSRPLSTLALVTAAAGMIALTGAATAPSAHGQPSHEHEPDARADWVGAWTGAPIGAGTDESLPQAIGFEDQTVRNVVHVHGEGSQLRFEFSNAYGERPLEIGSASVAVHTGDGAIEESTLREVRFGGRTDVVMPEGARVVSDPVDLAITPGTDLAVSIHLPGPTSPATWHQNAAATSYLTESGDHTWDIGGEAYTPIESWFYLTEVAVHGAASHGSVVAFGDSNTEGHRSTVDENNRYSDHLNRLLLEGSDGLRHTVLNAGIGGNRLLTNSHGVDRTHEAAQTRFARDVATRTGVERVIAMFGTNDLASWGGNADGDPATVADLLRGMKNLIAQAHAHDLDIMVGTVPPFGGSAIYTERAEGVRQDFNTWIRRSGEPDAVVDFDEALRDPDDPSRLLPAYDSGDNVHPSDDGYQAMAEAVDLRWVQGRVGSQPDGEDYLALGTLGAAGPLHAGVEDVLTLPLINELSEPTDVTVELEVPDGWEAEPVELTLEPGQDVVAEIPVTAPHEPAAVTLSATAEAGSALALGRAELSTTTVPAPELAALALDFGGVDTPVLADYRGVTPEDLYPGEGLGWVDSAPEWRDRETSDDLRRDFAMSETDHDFRFTIGAGEHEVHLLSGDPSYAGGMLVVSEDGTRLADTGDKLEAGEFQWLTFTLDGGDEGRTVDLTFSVEGDGTWRVNALAVLG